MIDALFSSKTRVKLLHLFMNNPGKSFYVREITRLIEEQINSVRRELANMLKVGVITSNSSENKLFYQVDEGYQHYAAFRAIFADDKEMLASALPTPASVAAGEGGVASSAGESWVFKVQGIPALRVAIASGRLVGDLKTGSSVDLLCVGDGVHAVVEALVESIESEIGGEVNYTVMSYEDFYYRLSVRDRFITEILQSRHKILVDVDGLLTVTDDNTNGR